MTRFSQRAIEKMRDMARVHDTSPPFEGDLRLDIVPRVIEGADETVALFEMEHSLSEGGAASGWKLILSGTTYVRSDSTYTVRARCISPNGLMPTAFRGEAFGSLTWDSGPAQGDIVSAVRMPNSGEFDDGNGEKWFAIAGGRTRIVGVLVGGSGNVYAPGSTAVLDFTDESVPGFGGLPGFDSRAVGIGVEMLCEMVGGDRAEAVWDSATLSWQAGPLCPVPDDEEEDPDPDDPADPPDGGGGGPGDAACYPCNGLPPGVDCSPLNCCPEDDDSLTVTTCEEFPGGAPEEYYVEVPPLNCVPDCATGNEPDATTGLPAGRVTLTHVADTCTWESDVFTCEGYDWYWGLDASLDGRSWLRLYRDDVVILQWQTGDAWCPRCDNDVEIYCPPDECTDLTAKLCVKPVCTSCADAICYTVEGPDNWTGVVSASFTWQGDDANSGTAVTDNADGRPNPPSRKITLVYGTVPANVDGAAVVETFPGITFDPTTCGVDLDGVCGIELSVKVQSDDSVGDRGIKAGIAIKQGSDSFIATIGTVREGDGWRTFEVNRLLAADFDKVTATGLDDATHPDWTTATGTAMTFGVALWQEDDTTDDELGGPITVVANWDILRLCLDSADCTGGPASYTCPETVTIAACQETGGTATGTITLTNDGDSSFTVVVATPSAELIACGYGGATITYGQSPPFGPVAPGADWTMTITVHLDAATTCSGSVTVTTDLPGAAATCRVPVNVVVLTEAACEGGDACATYHDDTRDYENVGTPVASGTWLSALDAGTDFEPYNLGGLSYSDTLLESDLDAGTIETAEAVENETKSGGGAMFNSGTNLSGRRSVIQPIVGMPENFALKGGITADWTSYTHGIGFAFGVAAADDWWAVASTRFFAGGPSSSGVVLLRQEPGIPLDVVEAYEAGTDVPVIIGMHVVGNKARLVVQKGTDIASAALLNSSQVNHTFVNEPTLEGTGFGLLRINGESDARGDNAADWGELCITDSPGLYEAGVNPPWTVAP